MVVAPRIGPDADGSAEDDAAVETTVLIVDDHRSFSELLCAALGLAHGLRCVGAAVSAAEGIALAARLRPDVVAIDIEMPHQDGLTATRHILDASPGSVVAVMTAHRQPEWVARAARAGASGFIPKNGSLDEMLDVIRRVRSGQMLVAPSVFAAFPLQRVSPDARPTLTGRELQVLQLLGQGMTAAGIGRVLGISLHTCRGYVKSLHTKLGASTQLELVVKAQHLGLISAPQLS